MSPRDRRALVLGATVAGLAVLALRIAPWGWRAVTETSAELRIRSELLARMEVDVRATGVLEDSAAVVRGRMATLAPKLLSGASAAEAAADLGSRLAVAGERHGVRVSRTDPIPDSAVGGLGRVALRAALESDTGGLLRLLEAIAREPAALVVDEVRIAVTDPSVPRDRPELLHTDLTLSGWYLPGRRAP